MSLNHAGKKAGNATFRVSSRRLASAGRSVIIGFALAASLGIVGCGVTSAPAGGASGTGSSPSGSSQNSQLSPSSSGLTFGSVTVGSATSKLVTLTVAGSDDVTISKVSASGTGFSVSGQSNITLAPNQSVTISVAFEPKAAGSESGKLLVSSNASNSSLQIGLSGDGVAASSNHSVALNWQPSTSAVTGYLVFRGSSSANLSQLNVSPVASTTYKDASVVSGQTYVYAVKSIDASNLLSSFSNTVTVTVPNP
ncbi:MAG: choice-of-anchor D domain-containing protein [Candidatus Acidiferrales bacterium]